MLGAVKEGALLMLLPMLIGCGPVAESSSGASAYGDLGAAELESLAAEASRWILAMNDEHRPHARRLTRAERAAFAGFFPGDLLQRARVREVDGIDNPEFYSDFFGERGRPLPIDFRQASGLALDDTILVVVRRVQPGSPGWLPLLFHEMVHLAQQQVQGEDHVAAYVKGWAEGGFSYRTIPQEEQAYELAARFGAAPERPFPVMAEVRRRFGEPR